MRRTSRGWRSGSCFPTASSTAACCGASAASRRAGRTPWPSSPARGCNTATSVSSRTSASHAIVLYREDTRVAVLATWKAGINNIPGEPVMLPGTISWQPKVTMKDVEALKAVVKQAGVEPTPYQVDLMRYQQWVHINDILEHPLEASYQAQVIENFKWDDWIDPAKVIAKPHVRSDTRLKNYPYRSRPVVAPGQ